MDSVSGGPSGGAGSECEGEDQEDPSSSSPQLLVATEIFENLKLQEESKNNEEDTLSAFREQWQRELVSTPSPQRQLSKTTTEKDLSPADTSEDRARQLFRSGIELERSGKLYEAVQQYKRAVQLCPDVEQRLYQGTDARDDTPDVSPSTQPASRESPPGCEGSSQAAEDLSARLQSLLARGALCEPEIPQKNPHISWLPYEVMQAVLRWVVSAEVDAGSLERAAASCRGLYLAARDPALWRAMCLRTWGVDCGTLKAHNYPTWRAMFIDRPRLNLNGCYISKTTYLRHGENAYQDTFYKPWYLIEYYRYLRFFPEGLVLMRTTAEEPASCVAHLKHRVTGGLQGVMSGHYRLIGDKVIIILKKSASDKKPAQSSNTRFRSRRKDSQLEQQQHEQMFHLEFELRSVRRRRNSQLIWRGYSVSQRRDQWTHFDLHPGKYPPFYFSRVRNYTAEATAPLI